MESVQITLAEQFGVPGRGQFYEETDALRDVVQNHLLQVVANLAVEPPISGAGEALRDERGKAFKRMRPLTEHSLVRGQFRSYRNEPGVAPASQVETCGARFVAMGEGVVLYPSRQTSAGHGHGSLRDSS